MFSENKSLSTCEGGGFSVQRSAFWISVSTFLRGCAARRDNNQEGKRNHDGPIYSLRSQ